MTPNELRDFLNEKVERYNRPDFISSDPIQIPHQFSQKEDIEIAGFLAATIAWGNRKMIIESAQSLTERMGKCALWFCDDASGIPLGAVGRICASNV